MELRQVQDAEIKDGVILSSAEEDSEKVKEIFGEDKHESKTIEINPVSFGKKVGEQPTNDLLKDPFEIEKESAKARLDSMESNKFLSGKSFALLVAVVVILHALFAYFIQTNNKTPQFASITGKQNQEGEQNNLMGILGETESTPDSFMKQQGQRKENKQKAATDLSAAALGQLAPGAGAATTQPTDSNQQNNNGELKDSDIMNILKKTD